jgi:hypothetical protein
MREEQKILLYGKVCAYLTGRLMGDPLILLRDDSDRKEFPGLIGQARSAKYQGVVQVIIAVNHA